MSYGTRMLQVLTTAYLSPSASPPFQRPRPNTFHCWKTPTRHGTQPTNPKRPRSGEPLPSGRYRRDMPRDISKAPEPPACVARRAKSSQRKGCVGSRTKTQGSRFQFYHGHHIALIRTSALVVRAEARLSHVILCSSSTSLSRPKRSHRTFKSGRFNTVLE